MALGRGQAYARFKAGAGEEPGELPLRAEAGYGAGLCRRERIDDAAADRDYHRWHRGKRECTISL